MDREGREKKRRQILRSEREMKRRRELVVFRPRCPVFGLYIVSLLES